MAAETPTEAATASQRLLLPENTLTTTSL